MSFKNIILNTPNVPTSLLLQIIIREKELILLIMPLSHAEEIIELSKEANNVRSSQFTSL